MPKIDIKFREATEDDLETILTLLENTHVFKDDIQRLLSNCILAIYDNKIVGCISNDLFREDDIFLLRSLVVAGKYRKKEIGRRLTELKLECAKEMGFSHVYARTLKINRNARGFFEHLNFHTLDPPKLYDVYPRCRNCRGEYERMNDYCRGYAKDKKCPVVTYRREI